MNSKGQPAKNSKLIEVLEYLKAEYDDGYAPDKICREDCAYTRGFFDGGLLMVQQMSTGEDYEECMKELEGHMARKWEGFEYVGGEVKRTK